MSENLANKTALEASHGWRLSLNLTRRVVRRVFWPHAEATGLMLELVVAPGQPNNYDGALFIEAPAGVGFSYCDTAAGCSHTDTSTAQDNLAVSSCWALVRVRARRRS
jgi:hypothetical protein